VGTPWHYDDYWVSLEAKSVEKGGNYVVKKYPAIKNYDPNQRVDEWDVQWPAVWTAERLAERKYEMGSVKFACLYLLDPSGFEGALFKDQWLTYFDPAMLTAHYIHDFEYYVGVDPNVSDNPESARLGIVTVAFDRPRGDLYVLDMYAEAVDFPTQIQKILEYGRRTRLPFIPKEVSIRRVGIEANTWQQAVSKAAYVRGLPVQEIKQKQTKVERILGLQPHFENGRNRFPDQRKVRVNWWDKFESEYLSYPKGKYKDLMDALELAFTTADVISEPGGANFAFGPPMGRGRMG